jgi:hypothetical protein
LILAFPGSRENNREFVNILAFPPLPDAILPSNYSTLRANSRCYWNREVFLADQGIHPSEQGIPPPIGLPRKRFAFEFFIAGLTPGRALRQPDHD